MCWIQKLLPALLVLFQLCLAQFPPIFENHAVDGENEIGKPHEDKCRDCFNLDGHSFHIPFPNGLYLDSSLNEETDKKTNLLPETFGPFTSDLQRIENGNSEKRKHPDDKEVDTEISKFSVFHRLKRAAADPTTPSLYAVGIKDQKTKLEELTKTIETLEQDSENLKEEVNDLYRDKKTELAVHPENKGKIIADLLEGTAVIKTKMEKIVTDIKKAQEEKKAIEDKIAELDQSTAPTPTTGG